MLRISKDGLLAGSKCIVKVIELSSLYVFFFSLLPSLLRGRLESSFDDSEVMSSFVKVSIVLAVFCAKERLQDQRSGRKCKDEQCSLAA